jgi:hypothetical protein
LFKGCHSGRPVDLPCPLLSRRPVSSGDRRRQRPHSRWAAHPETAAAAAAAGVGAVAAPGRLRQPPGSGGWAPGTEQLPPHPSPSSHSLEGKTKAERRLGRGAHGSPRRGRLPRPPSRHLRLRCAQLRSPARLGSAGGVWAGERKEWAAACPWSGGLRAPPAVALSRAQPGSGRAPPSSSPSPTAARDSLSSPGPGA